MNKKKNKKKKKEKEKKSDKTPYQKRLQEDTIKRRTLDFWGPAR